MTGKKKLILIPSVRMDRNKKADRNEHRLIRMSKKAREFLGFKDDQVEIWTAGGNASTRSSTSVLLDIFQAFSGDITKVKKMVQDGDLNKNDLLRIGFVTTKMYNRITGGDDDVNVWISSGVHDTVIGADPEFLLFQNGEIVHAGNVMGKNGIIGSDGAMAEVRPGPATTAEGLVKNISKAFGDSSLVSPIMPYDWIASCYYQNSSRDYPVGGHIHVGNPKQVADMPTSKRERFFRVLNKVMDELIAIPCIRLDGDLGASRRAHCQMGLGKPGWGYFGEWRTCNGRLEHRTLSGMWMVHPNIAKAVLGTAKAVTDEAFRLWADRKFDSKYVMSDTDANKGNGVFNKGFDGWKNSKLCQDMRATRDSTEMREILDCSEAGQITKSILNAWHEKMKGLSTYSEQRQYIDGLKRILSLPLSNIKKWDRRIQSNWLEGKKFTVSV